MTKAAIRLPRVNHVHAVLERDADDVVLGEVGCDWGHAGSDLVRLVGLCVDISRRCQYLVVVRASGALALDGPCTCVPRAGPRASRWRLSSLRARGPFGRRGWQSPAVRASGRGGGRSVSQSLYCKPCAAAQQERPQSRAPCPTHASVRNEQFLEGSAASERPSNGSDAVCGAAAGAEGRYSGCRTWEPLPPFTGGATGGTPKLTSANPSLRECLVCSSWWDRSEQCSYQGQYPLQRSC